MTFHIHFDWVESAPSADSLAQSTMAELTIEVDSAVVTSVLDRRSRSCRNYVVTPLGYVAQWLVGNWWRLFHEVGGAWPSRPDFAEAHDFACIGEGYLLPSLTIAPTPEKMRLLWRPQRPRHSAIEFTEQGEALVDRDALERAFADIVNVVLDRLADWLTDATRRVDDFDGGDWGGLRSALPRPSAQEPYRRGHDLARAARAQLQPKEPRYDFPTTGAEAIPCVAMQPPTRGIQGLVAAESPACTAANDRETARRFVRARALGDYLGRTTQGPAILSGLATDRQAQSRAFAAEFLVPAEALRKKLRSDHIPLDDVDALADEFGVSSYVVRHQIENHGLAQIADW